MIAFWWGRGRVKKMRLRVKLIEIIKKNKRNFLPGELEQMHVKKFTGETFLHYKIVMSYKDKSVED